jgi:hypothetical protein
MDMRTEFAVNIDGKEFDFCVETWQEAVNSFLSALNESGFTIDESRRERLIELATSGSVTVK